MSQTRPTPTGSDSQPPEVATSRGGSPSSWQAVLAGLKAGAIATVVMTAFRMPISRSPPPPARLAAKVAGGEPGDHTLVGLVLHLLYGTVAGGVFGVLVSSHLEGDDLEAERRGALLGSLYGLALSAFGSSVLLERVLKADLATDERFVFHVGHLIYGLTLGILVGSRR